MDTKFIIPRLSYEILNSSIGTIADMLGLTPKMVQDYADKYNWTQWFPNEEEDAFSTNISEDEQDLLDGEDIFTVRADQFMDKNRKRLQVFTLAKELALAELYADLEISIVNKAREAISCVNEEDPQSMKIVSDIFKNMSKDLQKNAGAVSFTQDGSGLPTVIIRDLSGS